MSFKTFSVWCGCALFANAVALAQDELDSLLNEAAGETAQAEETVAPAAEEKTVEEEAAPAVTEETPAPAVDEAEAPAAEEAAPVTEEAAAPVAEESVAPAGEEVAAAAKEEDKNIRKYPLFVRFVRARGTLTVTNPDRGAPEKAVPGKMYPMGTVFATAPGATATFDLGGDTFVLDSDSSAAVEAGSNPDSSRKILFTRGTLHTAFRDDSPAGALTVETFDVALTDLRGKGEYTIKVVGEETRLRVRTVTGCARIVGSQFEIPEFKVACKAVITTAANRSFSRIENRAGEYSIRLSNGTPEATLCRLTPRAVVKIFRDYAKIGQRLIVSTLVLRPDGMAQHRFAFADGRPEVATGELVTHEEGEENAAADAAAAPEQEKAISLDSDASSNAETATTEAEAPAGEAAAAEADDADEDF